MNNNDSKAKLSMNAMSEILTPKSDAKQVIGLVKNQGRITGYKLSDNRIVNKQDGVNLAKQGEIKGVGVSKRNGTEYLKSLPDQSENNNLSNLPTVK